MPAIEAAHIDESAIEVTAADVFASTVSIP